MGTDAHRFARPAAWAAWIAGAVLAAGLLSGCSASGDGGVDSAPSPAASSDAANDDDGSSDDDDGSGDDDSDNDDSGDDAVPCVVGTWQLDVPDYAAQSEAYVLELGIPVEEFAMTGEGTIQFTADGLVATDVDLTTSATVVADDARVPLSVPSAYTGSGDWSADESDTIDLENWANVPDPDTPVNPNHPEMPAIDYTGIPSVTAECSADTLRLRTPGAPLAALWHR